MYASRRKESSPELRTVVSEKNLLLGFLGFLEKLGPTGLYLSPLLILFTTSLLSLYYYYYYFII